MLKSNVYGVVARKINKEQEQSGISVSPFTSKSEIGEFADSAHRFADLKDTFKPRACCVHLKPAYSSAWQC